MLYEVVKSLERGRDILTVAQVCLVAIKRKQRLGEDATVSADKWIGKLSNEF